MRAVLVGNYGVENLGDEALKDYFLQAFPDIDWIVLSAHPTETQLPRLPAGIRSFFGTRWIQTIKAIKQSDALVFGGGSLFTDVESPLACILWFLHARAAFFFDIPYFLAFQGIGPFRTSIGKRLATWVIRHAAFLSVRDEESAQRVKQMKLQIPMTRTFDPVILLINKEKEPSHKKITVIPRANSGTSFFDAFTSLLASYPEADVSIILMQPGDTEERQIAERLKKMVQKKTDIVGVRTLEELCHHLQGSLCTLSQRYHGALAALALGIPVRIVSQAEGDKLSQLQQYAKNPALFPGLIGLAKTGESALREALKI